VKCDGLGGDLRIRRGPARADERRTFKEGCFELIGPWKDMGRWRRPYFQGVASTIERIRDLPAGALLETPWGEIPDEAAKLLLWGPPAAYFDTWRSARMASIGGKFGGSCRRCCRAIGTSKSRFSAASWKNT